MPFLPKKRESLSQALASIQIAPCLEPTAAPAYISHRLFNGKALSRIAKQLLWSLAASAVLAGCTGGLEQFQNRQAKTKAEFQHLRTEQQERANYAACVNQGAMPGSAENLACQLEMARKAQQAAKPQSPASKRP
jgi:hypothetical protein